MALKQAWLSYKWISLCFQANWLSKRSRRRRSRPLMSWILSSVCFCARQCLSRSYYVCFDNKKVTLLTFLIQMTLTMTGKTAWETNLRVNQEKKFCLQFKFRSQISDVSGPIGRQARRLWNILLSGRPPQKVSFYPLFLSTNSTGYYRKVNLLWFSSSLSLFFCCFIVFYCFCYFCSHWV